MVDSERDLVALLDKSFAQSAARGSGYAAVRAGRRSGEARPPRGGARGVEDVKMATWVVLLGHRVDAPRRVPAAGLQREKLRFAFEFDNWGVDFGHEVR